jgi:hypothetical protein
MRALQQLDRRGVRANGNEKTAPEGAVVSHLPDVFVA